MDYTFIWGFGIGNGLVQVECQVLSHHHPQWCQNCVVPFMDDRKAGEDPVIAHKNMVCQLMYVGF